MSSAHDSPCVATMSVSQSCTHTISFRDWKTLLEPGGRSFVCVIASKTAGPIVHFGSSPRVSVALAGAEVHATLSGSTLQAWFLIQRMFSG
jgi:hypothetical protein